MGSAAEMADGEARLRRERRERTARCPRKECPDLRHCAQNGCVEDAEIQHMDREREELAGSFTDEERRYLLDLLERDIRRAAEQPEALAEVYAPPRLTVRNKVRDLLTQQEDGPAAVALRSNRSTK